MTSKATQYRKEHHEYYAQECINDKEIVKNLYQDKPDIIK